MARKRKLDPETSRLWDRLGERHPDYPDSRRASILSAYRRYRKECGSRLVSDVVLKEHLERLFEEKGAKRGYAIAMHLRDALRSLWGDEAGATVTLHIRDIQPRAKVVLKSEWDAVNARISRLPDEWRAPFRDFVARCEIDPPYDVLSPFTLMGMAEALTGWARFRSGDISRTLTGADLTEYAAYLASEDVWVSGVLSAITKIYMSFTHILNPGFQSGACQAVLRDLKGRAATAGPCRKKPAQVVPASLIYGTGQDMMAEAHAGSAHNMQAATLYRNGLLLTIAAAIPLRRRALSSLDFATSFRLDDRPIIQIDIPGNYLKLRHAKKESRRYRTHLKSPILWDAAHLWQRRYRPMFDDGTALFPSARVRGEALVSDVLGQVFGEMTTERIGIRIPIHRIRDCVATEAIEEMDNGAGWARVLLDHTSAQTASQFYDHSTGVAVSREFGELVAARRSDPVELFL